MNPLERRTFCLSTSAAAAATGRVAAQGLARSPNRSPSRDSATRTTPGRQREVSGARARPEVRELPVLPGQAERCAGPCACSTTATSRVGLVHFLDEEGRVEAIARRFPAFGSLQRRSASALNQSTTAVAPPIVCEGRSPSAQCRRALQFDLLRMISLTSPSPGAARAGTAMADQEFLLPRRSRSAWLRRMWQAAKRVSARPGLPRRHPRQRGGRAARRRRRRAGLRRQHRLRQARQHAHRRRRPGALQLNLIRSHSVGVGAPLAPPVVAPDARAEGGEPGARPLGRARGDRRRDARRCTTPACVPFVPAQGSVGASGDLAPLAHLTLALIGEGELRRRRRAAAGRRRAARRPASRRSTLQAKEGLALINGTQVSTALALHALFAFEPVLEAALVIGALTVDAARGSDGPFDPRIHALRGQPGQIDVARYYRALLRRQRDPPLAPARATTACRIRTACAASRRSSAPASTSCATPRCVLVREANAVTDNPLVFAGATARRRDRRGGNFHAEPVALAADAMARRDRRGRRDRRAAHRHADRRRRLAPAAVPLRRAGPELAAS